MKRIREKIRSDKGASITFALLIFLVCAVVSSVILVAATTASGRISQEAQNDQRYYSVMSASELLKDTIDGTSVTYVEVKNTEDDIISEWTINDKPESSFSSVTAIGDISIQENAAYELFCNKTGIDKNLSLEVDSAEVADNIKDALAVTIKEIMDVNTGDLTFRLSNNSSNSSTAKYTLIISFHADIRETVGKNAGENTETTTKIITWNLADIQSYSA